MSACAWASVSGVSFLYGMVLPRASRTYPALDSHTAHAVGSPSGAWPYMVQRGAVIQPLPLCSGPSGVQLPPLKTFGRRFGLTRCLAKGELWTLGDFVKLNRSSVHGILQLIACWRDLY